MPTFIANGCSTWFRFARKKKKTWLRANNFSELYRSFGIKRGTPGFRSAFEIPRHRGSGREALLNLSRQQARCNNATTRSDDLLIFNASERRVELLLSLPVASLVLPPTIPRIIPLMNISDAHYRLANREKNPRCTMTRTR